MAHRADGLNDIFEHSVKVREDINADGGTVQQTPTGDIDIANKKYVDEQNLWEVTAGGTLLKNDDDINLQVRDLTNVGDINATTANLAGMDISNDGTKTTFLGKTGDYNRIGDAVTTFGGLDSEDDLLVTGEFEVEGDTRFNKTLALRDRKQLLFGNAADISMMWDSAAGEDDLKIGLSSTHKEVVITLKSNTFVKHDHTASADPTLFIHSSTSPDTDNTQWVSMSHNQTDAAFMTGKGAMTFGDGGVTNYTSISQTGDVVFVGGAGLAFGEIYVKDNTNATTLNSAAIVQVTDFAVNGVSNNTTPDHTNDHITITKAGIYKVNLSIHINNNAAQTHIVDVSVYKNDGTVEFANVHAHRTLTGGSGDVGSMSACGFIDVAVNDTIEVWATTGDAGDRSVTFEDINLNLVQVGGT